MQATVHAILLIALPLLTLLIVLALKRRIPTIGQFVVALALAALAMAAAVSFSSHACTEGKPRNQWLILGPCLFLTLLLIQSAGWRRIVAACAFIGMIGLSCHFSDLVHESGWTGNPSSGGVQRAVIQSFQLAAFAVANDQASDVTLPEGWLRDSRIRSAVEVAAGHEIRPRRQVRAVWHSPLTGLYSYTTVAQDIWTPGGPVQDAIDGLELRDRVLP